MPLVEEFTVLLPKASDTGNTIIATRRYDATVFVNRNAYYVVSRLEKVRVNPKWAKARLAVYAAGLQVASYAALDGVIELQVDFTDDAESLIALYNDSIDTEATLVLTFRSWQFGEV